MAHQQASVASSIWRGWCDALWILAATAALGLQCARGPPKAAMCMRRFPRWPWRAAAPPQSVRATLLGERSRDRGIEGRTKSRNARNGVCPRTGPHFVCQISPNFGRRRASTKPGPTTANFDQLLPRIGQLRVIIGQTTRPDLGQLPPSFAEYRPLSAKYAPESTKLIWSDFDRWPKFGPHSAKFGPESTYFAQITSGTGQLWPDLDRCLPTLARVRPSPGS